MPSTIKLSKKVGTAIVAPTIRWPAASRLSEDEKTAIAAYTREVETTIRNLAECVRELQTQLEGKTVG